ncbi:xylulokinase [Microbacterium sp. ASV81]|uniref:FGGY family carbohydrate kinase n=1 Tax=Microbacterium capsulatum TaxID=3041921 RepID=A0ABU0XLW8_9MICO|nr:FGGY family carbohydrate kinase [Microbacterium sp. ASV81]MDQ4215827.1 FGGY family carbohydrate kinase [Microbacterium sp. ASV81]
MSGETRVHDAERRGDALLGIDVGTSSAKVVATDLRGNRLADKSVPYPTRTDGSGAEQDARDWWRAVAEATTAVTLGLTVRAVAVTSQAPTFVPVDALGEPTGPALTWLDRRAAVEAQEILALAPGSRNGADPFFGTAKFAWLSRHRPAELEAAESVLATNGYIVRRLTGVSVLDDTTASLMQGFDEAVGDFSAPIRAAVPALALLPTIVPAGAIVGAVSAEASAATGIPAGTPVAAGGIDAIGSALEAGALAPGDPLVDMTGFSSVTMLAVPRGTAIPGFIHSRHCLPDVDLLITAQVTAGATIDWVNSLDHGRDLRQADQILARPRPGRLTMVPSLAGERTPTWNAAARGIVSGIDLTVDGIDLMLAAMEGNALALARDVDAMRAAGFGIDRLISTGGGASSDAWLQIKADVLGIPVLRPASGHGAAQGAAGLAGLATGLVASIEGLTGLATEIEAEFVPDQTRHTAYAGARKRFEALAAFEG